MIDPRPAAVAGKLAGVKRILAFAGAKGGVGKTICAVGSALALSAAGKRTGLLDLDFQGASAHILLGAELSFPEEASGIKPFTVAGGLELMSIAAFSGERPVPLRGTSVTEAILELLAVTVWGRLEFLIIDMPPGSGDEVLDLIRYVARAEFVLVTTLSPLALPVGGRLLRLLEELGVPVLGLIENMAPGPRRAREGAQAKTAEPLLALPLLGRLPYDPDLDRLIGDPRALMGSCLGRELSKIAARL